MSLCLEKIKKYIDLNSTVSKYVVLITLISKALDHKIPPEIIPASEIINYFYFSHSIFGNFQIRNMNLC